MHSNGQSIHKLNSNQNVGFADGNVTTIRSSRVKKGCLTQTTGTVRMENQFLE